MWLVCLHIQKVWNTWKLKELYRWEKYLCGWTSIVYHSRSSLGEGMSAGRVTRKSITFLEVSCMLIGYIRLECDTKLSDRRFCKRWFISYLLKYNKLPFIEWILDRLYCLHNGEHCLYKLTEYPIPILSAV